MPRADASPAPRRAEHLDWAETERLTGRLASRLRSELGSDLPGFTFLPVPRGGLLVLGMLAYLLELEKDRLLPPAGPPERVVLVDDCALSGARLARALERTPARRVVVAHLLSHPELRRAVEREEPRVERVLAAADLTERGDPPEAAARAGFEARWRERLPGRRYWLGAVEPVAFPWSEPESVWWNARGGSLEEGWHRVSPWRCLRFRAELGLPENDGARGPLDLAAGAIWKLEPGRLLVRGGPEDRIHGFRDVALDAWRGLLAFGDRTRTVRHLRALYDADDAELRRDVAELTDDLLARGLLAETGTG